MHPVSRGLVRDDWVSLSHARGGTLVGITASADRL